MANRNYSQFQLSHEKSTVTIYATVDLVSGVPVLKAFTAPATGGAGSYSTVTSYKGIKSISYAAVGLLTVNLTDNFVRLLDVEITATNTDGATTPTIRGGFVVSEQVVNSTTPKFVLGMTNAAGALALPAATDRLLLAIVLSNSSAQ
jgi:hypothetical protein